MSELKLNLGCNNRILPGYTNVDKDSYPGVDIISDVSNLPMIADNSADIVRASHILEHFGRKDTDRVLKEWYRILKPNGLIYISVPDFDRILYAYNVSGLCDYVIDAIYCNQGYEGADHKIVFDETRLKRVLRETGFREMSRLEHLPDCHQDECCEQVLNLDGSPISLNIMAIK